MNNSVTHEILSWLKRSGCKNIFIVPGVQIEGLVSAIAEEENLQLIIACHEQGAGFMADGYARVSGLSGVCMATGGPGANYLLASAMVARVDRSPVIFITGDVPAQLKEYPAFQDTGLKGSRDSQSMQIQTDLSLRIEKPSDLSQVLSQMSARIEKSQPVHLVVSYDVQFAPGEKTWAETELNIKPSLSNIIPEYEQIANLVLKEFSRAKRPLILAGHRVFGFQGCEVLSRFSEYFGIFTATTLRAKGIIPDNHRLSLGNFGYGGTQKSFDLLLGSDCDLLIVLGADLSQRDSMFFNTSLVQKNRRVLHIDLVDPSKPWTEMDRYKHYKVADINLVLSIIVKQSKKDNLAFQFNSWLPKRVDSLAVAELEPPQNLTLDWSIRKIRHMMPSDTIVFVDSGFHRIYASYSWSVTKPHTFFSSDQVAPMGWAICASIGGHLARPDCPALVITGDGCMSMHGMEIATAARYSLPIIYIISNNGVYQSPYNRARTKKAAETIGKLPLVDWAAFGKTLGADGCIVSRPDELGPAVEAAIKTTIPYIIDLRTDPNEALPNHITMPEGVWPEISPLL